MSRLSPPHPPRVIVLNQEPSVAIDFSDNIKFMEQAGILHRFAYCNSSKEEGRI